MNRNVIGERNRGGDGLVRWQYKKHFGSMCDSMYYQGFKDWVAVVRVGEGMAE